MPHGSTLSLTPAVPHGAERTTVFVVEDEDFIADLLLMIFTRFGRRIIRARDGVEALRLAEENRAEIGLAMVDLCLPDIAGNELCHKLRVLLPGLPVLLTSGNDIGRFMTELEAGGPTGLIAKPYRPSDLIEQVQILLPVAA